MHAAAEARRRFVNRAGQTGVLQRERRVQSRDAAADDDDARLRGSAETIGSNERAGRAEAGDLQEFTAAWTPQTVRTDLIERTARCVLLHEVAIEPLQAREQRRPSHPANSRRFSRRMEFSL